MMLKAGNYILIPLIISDSLRSQVIPQVEKTVYDVIRKAIGGVLKEDSLLSPPKSTVSPGSVQVGQEMYYLQTIYSTVPNTPFTSLLKHDFDRATSSKLSLFFGKVYDTLYRRFFVRLFTSGKDINILWKEEYAFAVYDKSDIDKIGASLPLKYDIVAKMFKLGWPNIAIYNQLEGGLHIYTKQNKGYEVLVRF